MLKKIICAALMMATMIFFGNAKIFAQDVPIETYSSRVQCFVMTETFINRTQYRDNRSFGVDVKFVGATVVVNNSPKEFGSSA